MTFPRTTLSCLRRAPSSGSLALALLGLTPGGAAASSPPAELQRLRHAPQPSVHTFAVPGATGVRASQPRADPRPELDTAVCGPQPQDNPSTRSVHPSGHAVGVSSAAATPIPPPWPEGSVLGDAGGTPAPDTVVLYRGQPALTVPSLHAIRLVLLCIEDLDGRETRRASHAYRAGRRLPSNVVQWDSFDQVWRGAFGFRYRPLTIVDDDLNAAIERAIDDPGLDTARADSALIKLPRPMPLADLPNQDRLVAVVARSASADGSTPHYAVAARLWNAQTSRWSPHFWNLHMRVLEDGAVRIHHKQMSQIPAGMYVMDQVEYVIYAPQAPS